jgi:hypothetical protein
MSKKQNLHTQFFANNNLVESTHHEAGLSDATSTGLTGNILACLKLSANVTIHNVVTGIINEPQKLLTSRHRRIYAFQL